MIKAVTLFSGYDSQALALKRAGVDFDLAAWCEIDRRAIVAHDALFPQWSDRNLGDITAVDWDALELGDIDLLTYSSPCQDFSSAGLQRGGDEGSGTRSSLLWEVEKAITALKPNYLLMENVSALVSVKFIKTFNAWQARLSTLGYSNFARVMNAKEYGVPQNRERIFMVSVRDDQRRAFYFPSPVPLTRRLRDVLEPAEDIPAKCWRELPPWTRWIKDAETVGDSDEVQQVANTVAAEDVKSWPNPTRGRIYSDAGIAPCECSGLPKIMILHRPHGHFRGAVSEDTAPTLRGCSRENTRVADTERSAMARKLTPRELYRLMDVDEEDIDKLLATPLSAGAHKFLAGNSIVVACLSAIFHRLFIEPTPEGQQTEIF